MSTVSIRYINDDVHVVFKFYTTHLGFELDKDASLAIASDIRDRLRLLQRLSDSAKQALSSTTNLAKGLCGSQILLDNSFGNPVESFQLNFKY